MLLLLLYGVGILLLAAGSLVTLCVLYDWYPWDPELTCLCIPYVLHFLK